MGMTAEQSAAIVALEEAIVAAQRAFRDVEGDEIVTDWTVIVANTRMDDNMNRTGEQIALIHARDRPWHQTLGLLHGASEDFTRIRMMGGSL